MRHFTADYFPNIYYSHKAQESLTSFYPSLQPLLTKEWFTSLQSFFFQWNFHTFGDKKTLSILAKIFEHTSQLPNLRTFAWLIDSTSKPPQDIHGQSNGEEPTYNPQENELPINEHFITSNSNLFPRVESMKISFYEENNIFVSIPILFFETYFSNTKYLSELQIMDPFICLRSLSLSLSLLFWDPRAHKKQ